MARFVAWWDRPGMATPSSVAVAAAATGSLVESGDNYIVGSLDFGDGGPVASIVSEGVIVRSRRGEMWLVRPGGSPSDGWVADHLTTHKQRRPDVVPRWIGAAHSSVGDILTAVLTSDLAKSDQDTEKRNVHDGTLRVDALVSTPWVV